MNNKEIDWKEEMQKCKDDPMYWYNKYGKMSYADRNEIKNIPKELTKNPLLPEDMLPGIGGTSFQIELNQHWFGYNEDGTRHIVVSKPKSPLYQRILSWLTFGLYKPTSFSYEVKEVKHDR